MIYKFGSCGIVAKKLDISLCTVNNVVNNSPEPVSIETRSRILKEISKNKYKLKARANRTDIKKCLFHGDITRISRMVGCSRGNVNDVLEGNRTDHFDIIKEAEMIAAVNVWKTKYCKFKSEL